MSGALRKYDTSGKGPYKDVAAFEFLKNKEGGIIKSLKEMALHEGQKNIQKLDNNLKVAQADLDDMNNMKRVVDEKERIHTEKMKGLENENKQLDEEVGELKQLLAAKKKTLNNLKKRNEQSRNHKKKLVEIQQKEANFEKASNKSGLDALNDTNDINVKKNKSAKKNSQNGENQATNRRKKKNETGCECLIS
jgi:myosin heavy subunit